jgi:hypothetical protein
MPVTLADGGVDLSVDVLLRQRRDCRDSPRVLEEAPLRRHQPEIAEDEIRVVIHLAKGLSLHEDPRRHLGVGAGKDPVKKMRAAISKQGTMQKV